VARAQAAVEVGRGIAGTEINHVQFGIDSGGLPDGGAAVLPRVVVGGPGVVAEFAGAGNGVKGPQMIAGSGIKGLHAAARLVFTARKTGVHATVKVAWRAGHA